MITSKCKGCSGDIVWVTTPSGKTMPLDAKANTLWVLEPEGAQQSGSPKAKPILVRAPHWASCPNADQFRKAPLAPERP